jgi:hypothetical protein
MLDKEKQKIKKAREAAGEDVDDVSPSKVRCHQTLPLKPHWHVPQKRKTDETEGGKAKKGRKGKTASDEGDDEEAVPEKKAKGTKKKKAAKVTASEDVDEVVKEEGDEDEE